MRGCRVGSFIEGGRPRLVAQALTEQQSGGFSSGCVSIRLVDNMQVGDFGNTRFHCLDLISEAGGRNGDGRVRHPGDIDLRLARPYGLNENDIASRCVEQCHHIVQRTDKPPKLPRVAILRK